MVANPDVDCADLLLAAVHSLPVTRGLRVLVSNSWLLRISRHRRQQWDDIASLQEVRYRLQMHTQITRQSI